MYRLLHRLFGYDYVFWEGLFTSGIARLHLSGDRQPYYWVNGRARVINSRDQVVWLTSSPEKYLPQNPQ